MKTLTNNLDWLVPSLIAFGALGFAWWSAVSASRSREAAERAVAAAELSAQADTEMAEMARSDRERAEGELRRRPWDFQPLSATKFRVTNLGATAYHVGVEADEARLDMQTGSRGHEVIDQGESFELIVIKGMGQNGEVRITWSESPDSDAERLAQRELTS